MKSNINNYHTDINNNSSSNSNRFLPSSLKFISSCIKTASSGVRSAAASISGDTHDHKRDQVLWSSFDRLELSRSSFKHVLLLGYTNGFQVLDVEDASSVNELVSRRDDPVTFLQMQPFPAKSERNSEGFRNAHPMLLVVACDESKSSGLTFSGRDGFDDHQMGNLSISPTAVRFYSLRSHNYVHVLRFRSTVYMVRCSPRIVAVGLAAQIYCFDALTLENKFSVLTYPIPQLGGQGLHGVNIGYGPMAVGPRWLAYSSNTPLVSNTGRLSPQSLTPPGISPSTSPSNGNLVARYAMESSKQLAAGLINLGDMGYKTLSRYYQDFVPDSSSPPVSPSASWKVGRSTSHSTETDIAGMVVVKDFVSRAVISQFRAHTSPISALCFDPSGTILVTASTHGNNINVFRILPSCSKHRSGSATQNYDWTSAHVHLYKLHRGMTSAVIQDICFSQYSQWIAIVTTRGTCHIFALAPFGGERVLQIQSSNVDGPTITPVLSLPWWSTPSFMMNQQSFPSSPPPPVTLSVVSRIKNNNSSWLHTVSNATSSAAGKAAIPSGALAAVFHTSVPENFQPMHSKVKALEQLLVYSPSGHVVQHKLLPSIGGESGESTLRNSPGSSFPMQDEELSIKVEALQGWDVCRRADWPEREECLSGITVGGRQEASEMVMDVSSCEDNDTTHKEHVKIHDRSHLYISNAEVQMNSARIPVWQNSKIHFFTMCPSEADDQNITQEHCSGEAELEKIHVNYIELRRRDLLPVFEQFHKIQTNWRDRGRSSFSSSGSYEAKERYLEEGAIQSKSAPSASIENSDGGSKVFYPLIYQYANDNIMINKGSTALASTALNQSYRSKDSSFSNNTSPLTSGSHSSERAVETKFESSSSIGNTEASNVKYNSSNSSMNIIDEGRVNDSPDFEHFFQVSCKVSGSSDCHESTEPLTKSMSHCDKDKSDEDGENDKHDEDDENDDMLGGVFAFSEEG